MNNTKIQKIKMIQKGLLTSLYYLKESPILEETPQRFICRCLDIAKYEEKINFDVETETKEFVSRVLNVHLTFERAIARLNPNQYVKEEEFSNARIRWIFNMLTQLQYELEKELLNE